MSTLNPGSLVRAVNSGNLRSVKNTARAMVKNGWTANFKGAANQATRRANTATNSTVKKKYNRIARYLTRKNKNYPLNLSKFKFTP